MVTTTQTNQIPPTYVVHQAKRRLPQTAASNSALTLTRVLAGPRQLARTTYRRGRKLTCPARGALSASMTRSRLGSDTGRLTRNCGPPTEVAERGRPSNRERANPHCEQRRRQGQQPHQEQKHVLRIMRRSWKGSGRIARSQVILNRWLARGDGEHSVMDTFADAR